MAPFGWLAFARNFRCADVRADAPGCRFSWSGRNLSGECLKVCGAEAEDVSVALWRKNARGGIGQNRLQEERRFSSGDSHFFLKRKECESPEKSPRVSRRYLPC